MNIFGWLNGMFLKPGKSLKKAEEKAGKSMLNVVRQRVQKKVNTSNRRKGFYDARGHNLTPMALRMKQITGMRLGAVYPDMG